MGSIKGHLDAILKETGELADVHSSQANEFIAVNEIEIAVHEARKAFGHTKDIDKEEVK